MLMRSANLKSLLLTTADLQCNLPDATLRPHLCRRFLLLLLSRPVTRPPCAERLAEMLAASSTMRQLPKLTRLSRFDYRGFLRLFAESPVLAAVSFAALWSSHPSNLVYAIGFGVCILLATKPPDSGVLLTVGIRWSKPRVYYAHLCGERLRQTVVQSSSASPIPNHDQSSLMPRRRPCNTCMRFALCVPGTRTCSVSFAPTTIRWKFSCSLSNPWSRSLNCSFRSASKQASRRGWRLLLSTIGGPTHPQSYNPTVLSRCGRRPSRASTVERRDRNTSCTSHHVHFAARSRKLHCPLPGAFGATIGFLLRHDFSCDLKEDNLNLGRTLFLDNVCAVKSKGPSTNGC